MIEGPRERELKISVGGTELSRELFGRQEVPEIGAGRITDVAQEIGQCCLISQWQADCQMQSIGSFKAVRGLNSAQKSRQMASQGLRFGSNARVSNRENENSS